MKTIYSYKLPGKALKFGEFWSRLERKIIFKKILCNRKLDFSISAIQKIKKLKSSSV
jgi:hypothetical protein